MSVKRSRPGNPAVRKGKNIGPDYPEDRFRNPVNAGIDKEFGSEESKTLYSPTSLPAGDDVPMKGDYDRYWEE